MGETEPGDVDQHPPADVLDKVRGWLRHQGYALEYETARQLESADLYTRQGLTYRDDATGKTREVDVVAELRSFGANVHVVNFSIVVECKSSKEPWIVRKAMVHPIEREWRPVATKRLVDYLLLHNTLDRMTIDDPTGFEIEAKREPNKPNGARDALIQVVSAARGLLRAERGPAFFHPVVLLDGELVSLWYADDGSEDLRLSNFERILWSGAPDLSHSIVVDVVTRQGFPTYMRSLIGELKGIQGSIAGLSFVSPKAVGF